MASIKIAGFQGTAPRISPELLPATSAQIARNCKLYSGDLIPYPESVQVASTGRTGTIQTLYALRNPTSNALVWLSWANDVSIVTPAADQIDEQRFYYAGDGVPKVSTYILATSGTAPYPAATGYYELGLPLPTTKVTTVATAFSAITTGIVRSRDTAYNATITTSSDHNIKDGATVSISGYTTPDTTFNTIATVTVTSPTTFTYYSVGDVAVAGAGTGTPNIDLGAQVQSRNYVYTWYTPWAEESIGSDPSETLFIKEGQIVTVSNLPTAAPAGQNFIRGIRLYRTLAGATETEYFRLATLWFPNSVSRVQRISGVARITFAYPHNLLENDRFKLSGVSVGSSSFNNKTGTYAQTGTTTVTVTIVGHGYSSGISLPLSFTRTGGTGQTPTSDSYTITVTGLNTFTVTATTSATSNGTMIVDGLVTTVIDQYTFECAQPGAANVSSAVATGTLYYDVAESVNKPSRYWGDGGVYTFTDDFDYRDLSNTLQTDNYTAPPDDLKGLVILQNNIMAGFSGNDVYFSEPNQFHAWPTAYKRSFESPIVGLAAVGGTLLVLTESYPYIVDGSDPAVMTQARLPSRYPCLNRRSIVETNFGVVYATHDGLAVFAPSAGAQLITRALHSSDTWNESLDPSTLVGVMYKDTYFASHSTASIVFDPGDKGNPSFVDTDFAFSAAWYDTTDNALYAVVGNTGAIYRWDDLNQSDGIMRWKSKVYKTDVPINIGAARVIADYPTTFDVLVWDTVATAWSVESTPWFVDSPITFRLYVDKTLKFTKSISDTGTFRLPKGYKSDTFEVEVEGNARVRAIHLGQTPTSLKEV